MMVAEVDMILLLEHDPPVNCPFDVSKTYSPKPEGNENVTVKLSPATYVSDEDRVVSPLFTTTETELSRTNVVLITLAPADIVRDEQ